MLMSAGRRPCPPPTTVTTSNNGSTCVITSQTTVAAHVGGPKSIEHREDVDAKITRLLDWNSVDQHASTFLENVELHDDGSLEVSEAGLYFVYSQVYCVMQESSKSDLSLRHYIYR